MFKSAVLSAVTFGLAAAMAAAAAAQTTVSEITVYAPPRPGVVAKSKAVNYRDLDIGGAEGTQTLLGRLRQASEDVCTPAPTTIKVTHDIQDYERCKTGAMDRALGQVKSPMLSALYGRVR
jgi:UrcA family protein